LNNLAQKKICIIGAGKVGSALYHSLNKNGYNIAYLIDSHFKNLKKITSGNKRIILANKVTREILLKSDVIIFAVQEKKLKNTISFCSKFKIDLRKKIIFHLSGIETSMLFTKLTINSLNTGSFHPLQTFNTISYKYNDIVSNIYFGVEGGSNAIKYFKNICRSFKSDYVIIPKNKKLLYHGACVIASNFMVSHFNIISEIVKKLSLKGKSGINIFRPIVNSTLNNIFSQGIHKSLTGPFERGDINTIKLHLKYFKENLPSQLYYYVLSGYEAMNIALKKKSITKKEAIEIEKLLYKHI
jgi:predicted short-subunit dehydrogenase-like oxidoreductase (DUF2520 family)